MANKNWQVELEGYIKQGEPEKTEKCAAWQTAIGLQAVDGLEPSEYLIRTAKEHIEGKIDMAAVKQRIKSYYEEISKHRVAESDNREADVVSTRITELLSEKTFQFSPVEWKIIHNRLFDGILGNAGKYRDCNITKKEWILNGDTVLYASFESIKNTVEYDFEQEKKYSYENLTVQDMIKHIAKFTADIWQIHPFIEGNTRATAVFIIKYLNTFGFAISNDAFEKNSLYFRNALVRANYNNFGKGIYAKTDYLERFFENLLIGTQHQLRNRNLHIDVPKVQNVQNDTLRNDTLKLTPKELAVYNAVTANPEATQKEIAERTKVSLITVKRITVALQEKRLIKRINGKRNGRWEIV